MDREIPKKTLQRERRKRWLGYGMAGLLLIGGIIWIPSLMQSRVNEKDLLFSVVDRGTLEVSVSASGKIVPAVEEIITSPVSARIVEVYRRSGDSVEAGTPLLKLDLQSTETEYHKQLDEERMKRKYSINSLVYWVTYVHNVVYSFYRSMIYCYINSTQRCAGSIVIDIIPTNGADKRKFFPFAPYFPVTNVIKRYFYPYFPAIIGIKGYSFPYFPYLSGIMKIKTALYSLFSRLDWHKTVVFPCLGEIYEGIRSLSWEIPVT